MSTESFCVYGFEYQGNNLLLAMENLLYSYIEYYQAKFHQRPSIPLLRKIACIISWNIWQMVSSKYVVPGNCQPDENYQMTLPDFIDLGGDAILADTTSTCPGCATGNIYRYYWELLPDYGLAFRAKPDIFYYSKGRP